MSEALGDEKREVRLYAAKAVEEIGEAAAEAVPELLEAG